MSTPPRSSEEERYYRKPADQTDWQQRLPRRSRLNYLFDLTNTNRTTDIKYKQRYVDHALSGH